MLIREVVGRAHGHDWNYSMHRGEPCPFLWHYHPEFELTLTRHSRGTRYLGGDVEAYGELDLVLVAPNCGHSWDSLHDERSGAAQVQVIFFTLTWLQALAGAGLPELHELVRWLGGVRQGVVFSPALTARQLALFDALEAARGLERLAILLHILDALPRDEHARHLGVYGALPGNGGSDRRLEAALTHLQQHFRDEVSLENVAAAAATSRSTLKRLFRERLGMGYADVLIELRIGHACHLLVSTRLPISRVAAASGFGSQGNFFRQFAALKACTPAEFRRQQGTLAPLSVDRR